MRTLRKHLRIVFGRTQPEAVIKTLKKEDGFRFTVDSQHMDCLAYRHYAMDMLSECTYEEVDALHHDMIEHIKNRRDVCGENVFALLPEYTLDVLRMDGFEPVCRQEQLLNWRQCYLYLGQDLLTTAHLAFIDADHNRTTGEFLWPSQIRTDDIRLNNMMKEGLAENHFHLNGSTRSFDLSWLCLMNHPMQIKKYFSKKKGGCSEQSLNNDFEEDLNSGAAYSMGDNRYSWDKRIAIACWIRVILFCWIRSGKPQNDLFSEFCGIVDCRNYEIFSMLSDIVETVRWESDSLKFRQSVKTGRNSCGLNIDYAITGDVLAAKDIEHCCRSLTGERAILYKALYRIYSQNIADRGENKLFMDLLYLYILIKTQFRSELIQVNDRYGFKNFAKYQDRKDLIFDKFPKYSLEAKNLSVNESMNVGNVRSLEIRISPPNKLKKVRKKVKRSDNEIRFLKNASKPISGEEMKKEGLDSSYFYVFHFPKEPEKQPKYNVESAPAKECSESYIESILKEKPRNGKLRAKSRKQSLAIAEAMQRWDWLCTRIRGIDACTYEIGCRPEVFATEFRFLRSLVLHTEKCVPNLSSYIQPKITATYHVGEDFMDIIDGLRAIDEAIRFLEMESGERLGHALALGVDPKEYYRLKSNRIVLSCQDMLDNIIWTLNKTKELGILIHCSLYKRFQQIAEELIYEIYHKFDEQDAHYTLHEYYDSWRLRGDDPWLYHFGYFDNDRYENDKGYDAQCIGYQYNLHRIRHAYHKDRYKIIRENKAVVRLYQMYHFDAKAKEAGRKEYEFKIDESYIALVYELQEKMMEEISRRHIGIECNPSSNVLIGPFKKYEKHPVFRFYPPQAACDQVLQFVSINTDDQGVFDTSLQMEFALLAASMRRMKKESDGSMKYNEEAIYDYLERLRKNGFSQTFPKTPANPLHCQRHTTAT